jgi:hypothetical protein
MRMTAELLRTASGAVNPLKDREINLRGIHLNAVLCRMSCISRVQVFGHRKFRCYAGPPFSNEMN